MSGFCRSRQAPGNQSSELDEDLIWKANGGGVHFWTPVGLRDYVFGDGRNAKCLKCFGGPEGIRTLDLFHAMEDQTHSLAVRTLKTNNLRFSR